MYLTCSAGPGTNKCEEWENIEHFDSIYRSLAAIRRAVICIE